MRQEGYVTDKFSDEILHSICPEDLLLNLAQLRNARHIQKLQPPQTYPGMGRVEMVEVAVMNRRRIDEEAKQKKFDSEVKKVEAEAKKLAKKLELKKKVAGRKNKQVTDPSAKRGREDEGGNLHGQNKQQRVEDPST